MKRHFLTSILYTIVTTVLFGLVYPFVITGAAQLLFHDKANGQLIVRKDGVTVGSHIIGQPFVGVAYFHSRPSAAGNGYDAGNSGGSNLGPTNATLVNRVKRDVAMLQQENPGKPIPADLITTSASGLDPDISPASADFQIPRVAKARNLSEDELRHIVAQHTKSRDLGFLGEPRVNVLELNLDLDDHHPIPAGK
jgi:potassium-transporting ATPase KdpC subunit